MIYDDLIYDVVIFSLFFFAFQGQGKESWRSALNEHNPIENNIKNIRVKTKQVDPRCVKQSLQKVFRPRVSTRLNGKCQLGPRGTIVKRFRPRGLLACYFMYVI